MSTDALIIQHHVAEGPGRILDWLQQRSLSHELIGPADHIPTNDQRHSSLILLGGPMSVHDDNPRLHHERHLLLHFIDAQKPVLGICLGAQLIAQTLGHPVNTMPQPEQGWQTITTTQGQLTVPQWHEDEIVPGPDLRLLASSARCQTQLFIHHNHILGIQFHPEWTATSIQQLNQHFDDCPLKNPGSPALHKVLQSFLFHCLDRWWVGNSNLN